ncbi:MAG: hypothetical protein JW755_01645 [Candidatus Aminicenantes bacterium]|nr:hypothetical protein [Candidatus Aminicenantes bacterium]
MCKKIISVVILAAFLCFSFSCKVHRVDKMRVQTIPSAENENLEIVGVLLINGKTIVFRKDKPARISDGIITGIPIRPEEEFEQVTILKSDIKSTSLSQESGDIIEILTSDGEKYFPVMGTVQEFPDKLEFKISSMQRWAPVSIPVSEVEQVLIRKVDSGKSFLASMVTAVAICAVAGLLSFYLLISQML